VKILTLSNLYPRPDRPTFGMFNGQLFGQMAATEGVALSNVCLVPEWRLWRWRRIRGWSAPPGSVPGTRYQPVFYLPVIGRRWSARLYGWWNTALKHEIQKADVVYASWLFPDGVTAARLAESANVKVWIMVLGSDTFHLRDANKREQIQAVDARVAGYVCVCQPVADRLVDVGIAPSRVHVVPNGVDSDAFRYIPANVARDALQVLAPDVSRDVAVRDHFILFVGNLVPVKGPEVCLDAFVELCNASDSETSETQLVFLGQGPMKEELLVRVRASGHEGRVHFLGNRPHGEMVNWMSLAACLCLSSRAEGMPNVVLESLSTGLPVVATDVGACREMLHGEPAGKLVASEDAHGLAVALSAMLRMDVDRPALAARHGSYTWRDQAERILEIIKERKAC
jgi:teichuronic acid biosynthesis glycosyltransferase TuaC